MLSAIVFHFSHLLSSAPLSNTPSAASSIMDVDYSLYLVTDSTKAVLGDKHLVQVVQQALEGGKIWVRSHTLILDLTPTRYNHPPIS